MARDRRRCQPLLAFIVAVVVTASGIVIAHAAGGGDELASTTKVLRHPPHRALEHLAHLARLQMPERFPRELGAVFAVNTVEKRDVKMWVEGTWSGLYEEPF